MQMELGVWDHFERRPGVSAPDQFREKVALVQEAERLGCRHYWVAEHHLSPLDLAPSPAVMLAALAQATSRIRLGAAVFILPLYHPLRFVQELCMLDNLSNGRLDLGVGRGVRVAEHDWFGVPRDEIRPRHEETLAIVINALITGNMAYDGEFHKFGSLPLDVLPVQKPYPPLWYAGGAETAGRSGFNFLGRGPDDVARYWAVRDESADRRYNSHLSQASAAITRHVVVRESYDEALAIARRAWPVFEQHWFATPILMDDDGRPAARQPAPDGTNFDDALSQDRRLLVGTPDMVRDKLMSWVDQLQGRPAPIFSPAVQWGDITTPEAIETLRLLAQDVMPAVEAATADT